jgi:hypothetical protein
MRRAIADPGMRPYNFLRAFEDRFVYEPGLFPPRAGVTANASAVDIGRTQRSWAKSLEVLRE